MGYDNFIVREQICGDAKNTQSTCLLGSRWCVALPRDDVVAEGQTNKQNSAVPISEVSKSVPLMEAFRCLTNPFKCQQSIRGLQNHNLITVDRVNSQIKIHRILQDFAMIHPIDRGLAIRCICNNSLAFKLRLSYNRARTELGLRLGLRDRRQILLSCYRGFRTIQGTEIRRRSIPGTQRPD